MKQTSAALTSLINGGQFVFWDCYTITLLTGTVIRITNANFDISDGLRLFSGSGVLIDDQQTTATASWKIGFDVGTWVVTLIPRPLDPLTGSPYPDRIGDTPWVEAARLGFLDGARFQVERAYFSDVPTFPLPTTGAVCAGMLVVFLGTISNIDIASLSIIINANDFRELFDIQMPRNVFQAGCRHTLFDAGCTLAASSFSFANTALAGSSKTLLYAAPQTPSGSGTCTLGRVVMTSGKNQGFQRSVLSWTAGVFNLSGAFPYDVSAGDTFTAYAGCDKQMTTCSHFGNLLNYGGEPYIPAAELAV